MGKALIPAAELINDEHRLAPAVACKQVYEARGNVSVEGDR